VSLTPAGDVLVRHAQRVTTQLTEARAELKAVRDAGRLL
jgi:DNA-binding transcriptional LysR family regulator